MKERTKGGKARYRGDKKAKLLANEIEVLKDQFVEEGLDGSFFRQKTFDRLQVLKSKQAKHAVV